jgi:hypothetical protein
MNYQQRDREPHPRYGVKEFGDWQAARQRKGWELSRTLHGFYGVGGRHIARSNRHNTCLRPSPSTKARLIAALSEHLVKHPNDLQSAARLRKLDAA